MSQDSRHWFCRPKAQGRLFRHHTISTLQIVHAFVTSRLDHCSSMPRSWQASLCLNLPVLIGFFAAPPVSLGAYRNMVLFRLICVTRYIGFQLLSASVIG